MVNYIESLKFPLQNFKNFIIGTAMSFFWFLLFPAVFVLGYVVETIRETLQKSSKLPEWFTANNWKTFLKHGIFVLGIISVYMIPPLTVSAASTAILGDLARTVMLGGVPEFNLLGLALLLLSVVLFLLSLFLLPMAIILYSASEDIRYAISFSEIIPRIHRALIPYLQAYLVSIALFFLFALFLFVPFVGFFLFGGAIFYPLLFSARLFAEVFRDYEY